MVPLQLTIPASKCINLRQNVKLPIKQACLQNENTKTGILLFGKISYQPKFFTYDK